jgi:hypothetical protein
MFAYAQLSLGLVDPAPDWIEELLASLTDDSATEEPVESEGEAA